MWKSIKKMDFESCRSAIKLLIQKPLETALFRPIVGGTPQRPQILNSFILEPLNIPNSLILEFPNSLIP